MVAAPSIFPVSPFVEDEEPRILLSGVPWDTYVTLRDSVEGGGVRMTYLHGQLEIMTTSRRHEVQKTQVARLLELFCLERDIPLYGFGNTTFRKKKKQAGLEPDECYSRGEDKEIPDVAIEIVVTSGLIDKLAVYRELGVGEIWVFRSGAFRLVTLRDGTYHSIEASEIFPEVNLARLAHFAMEPDQHVAVRAFRDELRSGTEHRSD